MTDRARIFWDRNAEARYPYGSRSPDPERFEPLGFPPSWTNRPWIYSNVITSRNGIVTWKRERALDDPVRAIAGGDFDRPGRRADLYLMRYLRAYAEAVSVGAQTVRDQPDLVLTLDGGGGELANALYHFRATHGLRRFPIQVVYSVHGRLDLDFTMFNTRTLTVIIVTTEQGAELLRSRGSDEKGITLLVVGGRSIDSMGLIRAHERLFDEFGVRYLLSEGGATALGALHTAGILDEMFVTVTDVHIDPSAHQEVRRISALEDGTASLVAEGGTASDPGYVFRRWRFNDR